MTLEETMRVLGEAGSEPTRRIYRRHGAGENVFGVKIADLQKLKKATGKDHALASHLWKTGNADAMMLATMIVDPKEMTESDLHSWAESIQYYVVADMFVRDVVTRSTHARRCMDIWRNSTREYVAQCGWDLVALAALNDKELPDAPFATAIERIEKGIASAPNRVRHAMNNALIAIGLRSDWLRTKALATASRIGKVNVDHGQTGCKTPDAAEYIAKTIAHRAKKAGA